MQQYGCCIRLTFEDFVKDITFEDMLSLVYTESFSYSNGTNVVTSSMYCLHGLQFNTIMNMTCVLDYDKDFRIRLLYN